MEKAMKKIELNAKIVALIEVKQYVTKEIEHLEKEIETMEKTL